jgi:hypothetical protein
MVSMTHNGRVVYHVNKPGLNGDTGVEEKVGGFYGPEDFGAQKPGVCAAAPFLRIAAALSGPPGQMLVAGDRDDTDGAGPGGRRFLGPPLLPGRPSRLINNLALKGEVASAKGVPRSWIASL